MVQSERSAAQLVAGATMTKDSRCALAGDSEEGVELWVGLGNTH